MSLREKDTPLALARLFETAYPQIDEVRERTFGMYPKECYIPISAAASVLSENYGSLTRAQIALLGAELTGLYIWRKDKIIYQFNDTLTESIAEKARKITGNKKVPVDELLHPDYHCIYVKSNYFRQNYEFDGFLTWIEWDLNRREYELRWTFLTDDLQNSISFCMHLTKTTIKKCFLDTMAEGLRWEKMVEPYPEDSKPDLHVVRRNPPPNPILLALQICLYLVSEKLDVEIDEKQRTANRKLMATQKNWQRLDIPESVILYNVGYKNSKD